MQAAQTEGAELTPRDIDALFQETDRVYREAARGCGVADSAYWILYDIVMAGGAETLAQVTDNNSLSRQTASSSVRALERRGLVTLEFVEGSRRDKLVRLTDAGRAFCERSIAPAMRAEARAIAALPPGDRRDLVRIIRTYVAGLDRELGLLRRELDAAGESQTLEVGAL